jgi:hypothetical protein
LLCNFPALPYETKYVALNKRRWNSKLKSAGISTFNGTFFCECVSGQPKMQLKTLDLKDIQAKKSDLLLLMESLLMLIKFLG